MDKKKILIVSHAMEIGGAEKSLLGLLGAFDTEEYDVDLFLLRHEGELMKCIPRGINLLPQIPAYTVLARPMKEVLKEGHGVLTIARLFAKIKAIIYDKKHENIDSAVELEYSHKYTCRFMPDICKDIEYDMAISFLTPHYFVINKVRAKKKLAWIHTDYTQISVDVESEMKMWSCFNYIVSISESVSSSFLSIFPDLKKRIILIENILSQEMIETQALDKVKEEYKNDNALKVLSIGRYCTAKNFDNIPEICSLLVKAGINIHWYIIGFGSDEKLIQSRIHEFHMEQNVFLLGKQENPYPYIKECDIYIQPSRYEGKCVTVREAQMLNKPVIITNYSTAKSQLENQIDGIIVPLENNLCAKEIIKLIQDKQRLCEIVENCSKRNYSNISEINKIYKLLL